MYGFYCSYQYDTLHETSTNDIQGQTPKAKVRDQIITNTGNLCIPVQIISFIFSPNRLPVVLACLFARTT